MKLKRVFFTCVYLLGIFAQVHAIESEEVFLIDDDHASAQEVFKTPEIPLQVPIESEAYELFRKQAETYLSGENTSECAKFVNRIFFLRFGKMMFGNAWDLQLKNKEFLDLVWKISGDSFDSMLNLKDLTERIDHFESLYETLNKEQYPIGVLGFVYRYSFYREHVYNLPNRIPQTHITFLAGRKTFYFENTSEEKQRLEDILIEKYGVIHAIEKDFVNTKIDLDQVLQPGERVYYEDYLVEEQFKTVIASSLLEVYLRKHRNNRVSSLLRPVSYSRISQDIIQDIESQKQILKGWGGVQFVSGESLDSYFMNISSKEAWKERLSIQLGIDHPEKNLFIPVPRIFARKP